MIAPPINSNKEIYLPTELRKYFTDAVITTIKYSNALIKRWLSELISIALSSPLRDVPRFSANSSISIFHLK